MILVPLAFPALFGYAVEAVRRSRLDPGAAPPAWHLSRRLLGDGLWTALLAALITAPFAVAYWPLALALYGAGSALGLKDAFFIRAYALLAAGAVLALPWGLALLLLVPAGLARYAQSGRPGDLFAPAAAIRLGRRQLPAWNLALATIVTAWALGLALAGLACLGLIPGVFYAILVSAHATARLEPPPAIPAGPPVPAAHPPAG